jgi:hypothetical protein
MGNRLRKSWWRNYFGLHGKTTTIIVALEKMDLFLLGLEVAIPFLFFLNLPRGTCRS